MFNEIERIKLAAFADELEKIAIDPSLMEPGTIAMLLGGLTGIGSAGAWAGYNARGAGKGVSKWIGDKWSGLKKGLVSAMGGEMPMSGAAARRAKSQDQLDMIRKMHGRGDFGEKQRAVAEHLKQMDAKHMDTAGYNNYLKTIGANPTEDHFSMIDKAHAYQKSQAERAGYRDLNETFGLDGKYNPATGKIEMGDLDKTKLRKATNDLTGGMGAMTADDMLAAAKENPLAAAGAVGAGGLGLYGAGKLLSDDKDKESVKVTHY